MRLWVDSDVRSVPFGYRFVSTVPEAIKCIEDFEVMFSASGGKGIYRIDIIDIGCDAGNYAEFGGEYIGLLCWLEKSGRSYPIHLHGTDPHMVEEMRRYVRRNHWKET